MFPVYHTNSHYTCSLYQFKEFSSFSHLPELLSGVTKSCFMFNSDHLTSLATSMIKKSRSTSLLLTCLGDITVFRYTWFWNVCYLLAHLHSVRYSYRLASNLVVYQNFVTYWQLGLANQKPILFSKYHAQLLLHTVLIGTQSTITQLASHYITLHFISFHKL